MAPNLSNLNGALKNLENKPVNLVRTRYVVQNIFGYLLRPEYSFPNIEPKNNKEIDVLESLKDVVDVFKQTYSTTLHNLSATLDVTPENLGSVLLGVSNELFCEGISWSKITTFFVFISELTIQCLRKDCTEPIVEETFDIALKFVEDFLEKWVIDHNGWEGFIEFSRSHKKNSASVSESSTTNNTKNCSWAKSVLNGTVRAVGILAHLALIGGPVGAFSSNSY